MKTYTVCNLDCPDTCSLMVTRDREGKITIEGNPDHPFTRGFTCAKIKNYMKRLRSPHRIVTPLRRVGTKWRSIGWEEALALCAEKIQQCRSGPASIVHLHGEGARGVLKYASNLFFGRLGASHAIGSLCDTAGIAACMADFGSLEHNDIRDIVNAGAIVNWGKDLSRSSIHIGALVREARRCGTKVITISPGGDGNGPFSDYFVRIRPATDRFLAAALIRLCFDRGVVTNEVLARTYNGEAFKDLVCGMSMKELLRQCEVAGDDVERLFECYTGVKPVATLYGWGLQRYRCGGETVRFINALAFLSGNIGSSGSGMYYNISSLRSFNLDWAYDSVKDDRRTFPQPLIGRSIAEARDPKVRMIWVNGFNVVNQAPESRTVRDAFRAAEFTVVVDAFMTDTAELADVILPCSLFIEQEDVVGSFVHNYIHYADPAVQPPGEARDDFWIFSELGTRLNPPVVMPGREAIMEAALDSPYLDISLEELKEQRFVEAQWPEIAYEGMTFGHPDGLYRFPAELNGEPLPPDDFPLRLLSLVRRNAIHSQILQEDQDSFPKVWVAPDSPALNAVDLTKAVFLASPRGRIRVEVNTLSGLHPEAVIYRRGDWMKMGGGINQLIEAGLTDMGCGAPYYDQFVRLEN